MRRTKEKLRDWVDTLRASGIDIDVEHANDYWKFTNATQSVILSGGLTLAEAFIWLSGFENGRSVTLSAK